MAYMIPTELYSDSDDGEPAFGGPAVATQERPAALRPCLATGLPFRGGCTIPTDFSHDQDHIPGL